MNALCLRLAVSVVRQVGRPWTMEGFCNFTGIAKQRSTPTKCMPLHSFRPCEKLGNLLSLEFDLHQYGLKPDSCCHVLSSDFQEDAEQQLKHTLALQDIADSLQILQMQLLHTRQLESRNG